MKVQVTLFEGLGLGVSFLKVKLIENTYVYIYITGLCTFLKQYQSVSIISQVNTNYYITNCKWKIEENLSLHANTL